MNIWNFGRLTRAYYYRVRRLYGNIPELWPSLGNDPQFFIEARKIGYGMAQQLAKSNAIEWRKAAKRSSRAQKIYKALKSEVERSGLNYELDQIAERNARLITSLPLEISEEITKRANALFLTSGRPGQLAKEIKALAPEILKTRVALIARTEVSRAETDLTRARAERMGIQFYQWRTSEDSRVRASHRNMDGVLVAWSDPPSPEALAHEKSSLGKYAPGQAPNCRCLALPLADLDEVDWPAKVFQSGSIKRMSRAQFTRAIGIPLAA